MKSISSHVCLFVLSTVFSLGEAIKSLKRDDLGKAFLQPRFEQASLEQPISDAFNKENQRTFNLEGKQAIDEDISDQLKLLSKIVFSREELQKIKGSIMSLSTLASKFQKNETPTQRSFPHQIKVGNQDCLIKWKYYETSMPIKGGDSSVVHGLSPESILSVNCVAYNKLQNVINSQSDPISGKFLYHWFLDEQRVVLLRNSDDDGYSKRDSILEEAIVKITISYYDDCDVGKTCLSLRICRNQFRLKHEETQNAAFLEKEVLIEGGVKVKLNLWDTAGQEKFRAINNVYYRSTDGAILVYDITSHASFEKVISWVRELKEFCEKDAVIALVGNKVDLQSSSQVTDEEARALAEKTGATHFLTSAKANINLDKLVLHMATKINEKNKSKPQKRRISLNNEKLKEKNTSSCC